MTAASDGAAKVHEDLIFDVGLHRGEDTSFYLAKGFSVVAVEANPSLCEEAKSRFQAELATGRLIIVNAAIAPVATPLSFYTNSYTTEWGTTDPAWAERNAAQFRAPVADVLTVQGVRFESLLEEYGVPHYLKVDIEGADLLCIEALRNANCIPRYLSIESNKRSWRGLLNEFELLDELGYRRFKVVNQRKVQRQRPPYPPREGRYVPAAFQLGASGMFGEEAPGRWLSKRQAIARYAGIFARYEVYGDYGPLRRRPGLGRIPERVLSQIFGNPAWYDTHASQ